MSAVFIYLRPEKKIPCRLEFLAGIIIALFLKKTANEKRSLRSLSPHSLFLQFLAVSRQNSGLDQLPGFGIDGMGDILEFPIGGPFAGHGHKKPIIAFYDPHIMDHKLIVDSNRNDGFHPALIRDFSNPDIRNLQSTSPPSPSC
jgi:hypothetical protein